MQDHLKRGDPLPTDAATWNAILKAAKSHAANPSQIPQRYARPAWIKKTDAGDLPRFSVVAVGDFVQPSANRLSRMDIYQAADPMTPGGLLAITSKRCRGDGGVAPIVSDGLSTARLTVTDSEHSFAKPAAGNSLISTATETGVLIVEPPVDGIGKVFLRGDWSRCSHGLSDGCYMGTVDAFAGEIAPGQTGDVVVLDGTDGGRKLAILNHSNCKFGPGERVTVHVRNCVTWFDGCVCCGDGDGGESSSSDASSSTGGGFPSVCTKDAVEDNIDGGTMPTLYDFTAYPTKICTENTYSFTMQLDETTAGPGDRDRKFSVSMNPWAPTINNATVEIVSTTAGVIENGGVNFGIGPASSETVQVKFSNPPDGSATYFRARLVIEDVDDNRAGRALWYENVLTPPPPPAF